MDINLTAPINDLGYGVVSLNVALALGKNHDVALWPIGGVVVPAEHQAEINEMRRRTQLYDRDAPSLRIYHQNDLAQHVGKGPHCAYPFFELDRLKPVEKHHLKSQDFVFVPSTWAADVLVENGVNEGGVVVAHPGVDHDIFRPRRVYPVGPTVFMNCGKWEYRKGHDVLLEAFNKAFEPSDDVMLVMNCHNPCGSLRIRSAEDSKRYNDDWVRAYKTSKLGEKTLVRDSRLPTQRDVAALMASADCGVFPSRAEGWGLESAEMLAMGKHVILTAYSAHTDYATADNSLLIDVSGTEEAHDGHWFDATSPEWGGEPGRWARLGTEQVDQLVEHMRVIHRRKQSGELGTNTAGVESMKKFTWDATAAAIVDAL